MLVPVENVELVDYIRDMDEMVVTATRTPKTLKNVPVQTCVISRSDIEKSDATNLQDLLEMEIPGVEYTIAMNGLKNMNLSGFSGQNVLILVDGERLSGETNDNVDYTRLSMANVERVEIVRGSASALYGSNAESSHNVSLYYYLNAPITTGIGVMGGIAIVY